jgi:hypothetical protein
VSSGSTNSEGFEGNFINQIGQDAKVHEDHETQIMNRTLRQSKRIEDDLKNQYSYINCDIRYFNFDFLTSHLGHFDGSRALT